MKNHYHNFWQFSTHKLKNLTLISWCIFSFSQCLYLDMGMMAAFNSLEPLANSTHGLCKGKKVSMQTSQLLNVIYSKTKINSHFHIKFITKHKGAINSRFSPRLVWTLLPNSPQSKHQSSLVLCCMPRKTTTHQNYITLLTKFKNSI